VIQRILRIRPFLWVAGILLLAILVSLTWEHQTSYDDGGIGSAAFLVISLFVAPGQWLGLGFNTSVVVALLVLVVADLVVSRMARRRSHVARHS
jgi:apolipoprotein N-acyltransferase